MLASNSDGFGFLAARGKIVGSVDPIVLHTFLHSASYSLNGLEVGSRAPEGRNVKQAAISCLRMKIDHLTYVDDARDDTAPADPPEKGSLNVISCMGETMEAAGREPIYSLRLHITVEPEAGCTHFALDMSVTGMFAATDPNASEAEVRRALDTIGVPELYAFARDRIAMLRQGAAHQKSLFPLLEMA